MRTAPVISRDELERLVGEYHHLQEEHRRARRGSRVRRHLRSRLEGVASRFERLLLEAVEDELERDRWRAHLRHRAPEPATPEAGPPLLFRGRSDAGSTLELLERPDGTLDAIVDGALAERLDAADELLVTAPGLSFRVGGASFEETFSAPATARASLMGMLESGGPPPYGAARELMLDGLIDRNFGLTARGRRALALDRRPRPRRARQPAVPIPVSARGRVSARARAAAERRLSRLVPIAPRRVLHARVVLEQLDDPALERPAVAKATLDVSGRIVRAHVAAAEMTEAVDLLADRLRGRLLELSEREEADRRGPGSTAPGRWRHGSLPTARPGWFPRPREERELVRRKTFTPEPVSVEEAAWEMRMLDHDFHLFTDAGTGGESVLFAGEDGGLRLRRASPSGEPAAAPAVAVDPAPVPTLSVDEALEALEVAGEPFLFFVERGRGRGAVAYRRYDGHCGLVAAAGP